MKTTPTLFRFSLILFLIAGYFTLNGQTNKDTTIYVVAEQMPEFPGGQKALMHYIYTHINYPDSALKNNIHGIVYVRMVVEPDSTLSDIKVVKGIGYGCNDEAMRVVSNMPKWIPGKMNGKNVRVAYMLPVIFRINAGPSEPVYTRVDSLPVFAVGLPGISSYLESKLMYPTDIIKNKIVDTVNVEFIVGKDTSISQVRLLKPKDTLNAYDYEAMRVVKKLPVSGPAILNNKPVNVRMFVPVVFDYRDVDTLCAKLEERVYDGHRFNYYKENDIYAVVEKMPEFPGGMAALMQYLAANLWYPEEAKNNHVFGKVYINFVVECDGSVNNVRVLRGVSKALDEVAVKVISNMPKWSPGMAGGVPVRVSFNLPVNFTLLR